jgi:tRNA-dihydrouridine synthase A
MMDWTDRHCRTFHRILSRRARLYTEMFTPGAVIHGDRERVIGFGQHEQPVAVQLGGSEPAKLAEAAKICVDLGYIEVNLNCGCPSDRVQGGHFGACLMREPELVAECVQAMKQAVAVPVTVKCRIGVDEQDPEQALFAMANAVVAAGADALIVHARSAWLQGLSPKENRDVPPLNYDLVYQLKRAFPQVPVVINGGILDLAQSHVHLAHVDGVMLGRAAYQNPELLSLVDAELFDDHADAPLSDASHDTFAALAAFRPYVAAQLERGVRLHSMTKHLLGLFPGQPGARRFRRYLSTEGVRTGASLAEYDAAIAIVREEQVRIALAPRNIVSSTVPEPPAQG